MGHPSLSTENIRLDPVFTDRESEPTANCSPVSPFLRFVVTEPSRMKPVRHMGLFREFVGTACCVLRTVEYDHRLAVVAGSMHPCTFYIPFLLSHNRADADAQGP